MPASQPPVLFEGDEVMQDVGVKHNDYLYLEVQQPDGQWEGVTLSQPADGDDAEEAEAEPETKSNVDGDGEESEQDEDEEDEDEDEDEEQVDSHVRSHGVVGLQNLGNTCFLNAAVQCLSHSLPLQQYLLSSSFVHELNRDNFLGHKGRVPIALEALLRALYAAPKHSIHSPRNLRALIRELNPMFEGNLQHDAQEALQFLLQGMHQDLNRVREKPPRVECADSDGRRDEVVAREAWRHFGRTEDSVIADLFMGQFRSTTTCLRPGCGRRNHKFDTYQMLSLPIPALETRCVHVVVHFAAPLRLPVRYSFKVPDATTMQDLRDRLADVVGVPPDRLIPAHVVKHSIHQLIALNKQMTGIHLTDVLMLFEAPPWAQLARPERGLLAVPLGLKVGQFVDVKDRLTRTWCHCRVLELCHASRWADSMRNAVYVRREQLQQQQEQEQAEAEPEAEESASDDPRSEWRMKVRYVAHGAAWDEWLRCDDAARTAKAGTHCQEVPSEIKYPRPLPQIPQHVVAVRCLHRRLVRTKAALWAGRGFEVRTFGTPLLAFLPRDGCSALELYHFVWRFVEQRLLEQHLALASGGGAVGNAYVHLFGGHVFADGDADALRALSPPFVLRVVDKLGAKSARSRWHEYSVGTLIDLAGDGDEMVRLGDDEYVAIDWNEAAFRSALGDEDEAWKGTGFLNSLGLVTRRRLDDASVTAHLAQLSKAEAVSIGDCIREFQREEKLSEYLCEGCARKGEASKALRVWSTAPILVVHLKRTGAQGRKIHTDIDFLLRRFDVAPLLVPRTRDPALEAEAEEEEEKDEAEADDEAKEEWPRFAVPSSAQTQYNLFGAVNHYGAAGGGHYIANCLCLDGVEKKMKWFLFDDHRVTAIAPSDVKSKNAYLLFYVRSDLQALFEQHLEEQDDDKLFDAQHIDADKHFEFLPEAARALIGSALTAEQTKLLHSEGVETSANRQCVIL